MNINHGTTTTQGDMQLLHIQPLVLQSSDPNLGPIKHERLK